MMDNEEYMSMGDEICLRDKRIEELEHALNDLLSDCINFDGGKLTDRILKQASDVLNHK